MAVSRLIALGFVLISASLVSYTVGQSTCTLTDTDYRTLNYALTLENLEAAFYSALNNSAYPQLSQASFANAGYAAIAYSYLQLIGSHENTHVAALQSTLTSFGCNFTLPCAYNFTSAYANPTNFIATALALESTGVAAYDGAISTIFDGNLRQVAATIATVEARHTAFLATLIGGTSPFPQTVDTARNSSEIYAIAAGFLVNPSACYLPSTTVQQCNYTGVYNNGFQTPSSTGACGITAGDITVINYALALEHLEAAYYRVGLNTTAVTSGLNSSQLTYLRVVRDHEAAHVAFLQSVLAGYGCASSAAPACTYNFGAAYSNTSAFLATAAALEETGVTAYDGALWNIRDSLFRQAAASIATVEARHAAYLNLQIGANPFPSAFDTAANSSSVLAIAGQFISACPTGYTPSGPAFVPVSLNCSLSNVSGGGVPSLPPTTPSTTGSFSTTGSATVGIVCPNGLSNLALGSFATQSGIPAGSSAQATANLVDGDLTTYAETSDPRNPYFQIDLGSSQLLNFVTLYVESSFVTRLGNFYIFAGDNNFTQYNFTTLVTGPPNLSRFRGQRTAANFNASGYLTLSFSAGLQARYIRIQRQSGGQDGSVNTTIELNEIAVCGAAGQTTGAQSTGVQTTGVQSTGVQTTGVQTTRVQTTGVQSTGVQSTGVQTTGVQTTGVQTTAAQSTGVQTTGVQSTGVQTTAAQSTGVQTTGVQTTAAQSTGVQTTRVQTTGVQTTAAQTTGVQTTAAQSTGVQTTAAQTTGVQTTAAQSTGVQTTAAQTTGVQTTAAQSTGVQTTGVQTTGVQTTAAQSTGVQTTGVQTTRVQTTAAQSTGVQTTGAQSTGVQTTAAQSTGVQTTGVQTTGVQTTGVQTTAAQSTGVQTTAARTTGVRATTGVVPSNVCSPQSDLAITGTPTQSGVPSGSTAQATANLIDGDLSTYAEAADSQYPYVQVDLGQSQLLNRITIYIQPSFLARIGTFNIFAGDNNLTQFNFTELSTGPANIARYRGTRNTTFFNAQGFLTISFSAGLQARYIRVQRFAGGDDGSVTDTINVNELFACGSAGQTTLAQTTGVQTTDVQTTAAQAQSTGVQTTAAQTTGVQTTGVQTTGVQTTGVQSTGVQTTAVQTTAVQTTAARASTTGSGSNGNVCGSRLDVALGTSATQSTTVDGSEVFSTLNVIDGDLTTFARAADPTNPFIQVDLGTVQNLSSIVLYVNSENIARLGVFYVFAATANITDLNFTQLLASPANVAKYRGPRNATFFNGNTLTINFSSGLTAQYIRVQRQSGGDGQSIVIQEIGACANSFSATTGVQTTDVQTTGAQSTGVQTTGAQTTGVQTTGAQTTGVQSTGVQSTGRRSTGRISTTSIGFELGPCTPFNNFGRVGQASQSGSSSSTNAINDNNVNTFAQITSLVEPLNPWIELDLDEPQILQQIRFVVQPSFQADLANFYIFAGNTNFDDFNFTQIADSSNSPAAYSGLFSPSSFDGNNTITVTFNGNFSARYVRVQRASGSNSTLVSLNELSVCGFGSDGNPTSSGTSAAVSATSAAAASTGAAATCSALTYNRALDSQYERTTLTNTTVVSSSECCTLCLSDVRCNFYTYYSVSVSPRVAQCILRTVPSDFTFRQLAGYSFATINGRI